MSVIETASRVLRDEAAAVLSLVDRLDGEFEKAVCLIEASKGRVVLTGMGKSGHIARKVAATMASTGTPAFFLHPAEGIHGDLGMVTADDVVIAYSNSGETGEVLNILPSLKRIGAKLIAVVGKKNSTLAKNADAVLDAGVKKEADSLGLAPTSSTTAALALGDALAVSLMERHHFTADNFAVFHPGGSLGKRLLLTVEMVMHKGEDNPLIDEMASVKDALFVMTDKGLGAVSVTDREGRLLGLMTDGDVRRGLEKGEDFLLLPVRDVMTKSPMVISQPKLAAEALHIMEKHQPHPITVLPVCDEAGKAIGMVHITDLLRQGGHVMIGAEQVKLIAFDVDGTLTDGTLVMGSGGEAYKLFNAHDGLVISLAHRMGYAVGFITGRTSPIVEARAKELSCDFVLMGIRDKVSALQQLLMERAFCWDEAAYMGDDLNDLPLFSRVGLSGCPADACEENQSAADFISRYDGGRGAAREFIECILRSQGRWEEAVSSFQDVDQEDLVQ